MDIGCLLTVSCVMGAVSCGSSLLLLWVTTLPSQIQRLRIALYLLLPLKSKGS